METPETKKNKAASAVIQTAIILFCLTVYAAGVVLFILPSGMIAAGATGLGLFAEHYFGIPLSGFVAIFNIAMFGLGWLELGKKFAATTLIATFYYPFILNRLSALAGKLRFHKRSHALRDLCRSDNRIFVGDRDPLRSIHRRHGHSAARAPEAA